MDVTKKLQELMADVDVMIEQGEAARPAPGDFLKAKLGHIQQSMVHDQLYGLIDLLQEKGVFTEEELKAAVEKRSQKRQEAERQVLNSFLGALGEKEPDLKETLSKFFSEIVPAQAPDAQADPAAPPTS